MRAGTIAHIRSRPAQPPWPAFPGWRRSAWALANAEARPATDGASVSGTSKLIHARFRTPSALALWTGQMRLALRPKNIAVEVRNPLPAARSHVQIADRKLNAGSDVVPIKLRI